MPLALESAPSSHTHFTRLQWTRGAMDPIVAKTFDEMLKRMEDLDAHSTERWGCLEKRVDDVSTALWEREIMVDSRTASLEDFVSSQYTTTVVADNWGSHFESRVSGLETCMADLELIRLAEIRDEHDDRVEALEQAVAELQAWRPEVNGYIDDARYELHRLTKSHTTPLQQPTLSSRPELISVACSGGSKTDWPSGHCNASTTWETSYSVVTTVAPTPTNGMSMIPQPDLPPDRRPAPSPFHPYPPPRPTSWNQPQFNPPPISSQI